MIPDGLLALWTFLIKVIYLNVPLVQNQVLSFSLDNSIFPLQPIVRLLDENNIIHTNSAGVFVF